MAHVPRPGPPGVGPAEPPPPPPATIANEIAALTRVVSDAGQAAPGKLVNIEVIPGTLAAIPTFSQLVDSPLEAAKMLEPGATPAAGDIGGTLTSTSLPSVDETFNGLQIISAVGTTTLDGTVTVDPTGKLKATLLSTVDGVLATLSHTVEIEVHYAVRREGQAAPLRPNRDYKWFNGGLNPSFLLVPRFVDETAVAAPTRYFIDVEVYVAVHLPALPNEPRVEATKKVEILVVMPNVPVPAVFVYGAFGPDDLRIVVMVRRRSQLQSIGQVVATLNAVLEVLSALRGLFAVASLLVDGLGTLAQLVATTPRATISVGDIPDLESHDDLANVGGAALLFGVSGTWIRLYDDTNYEDNTFDMVVPDATISGAVELNVGYLYIDHVSRQWDDNQAESVRWEDDRVDLSSLLPKVP